MNPLRVEVMCRDQADLLMLRSGAGIPTHLRELVMEMLVEIGTDCYDRGRNEGIFFDGDTGEVLDENDRLIAYHRGFMDGIDVVTEPSGGIA